MLYYEHERFRILHNDCLKSMKRMPSHSVDSVVTDPPYGLSFMGKMWDHGVPGKRFWTEALRVAKPGAYLLAFGGTRTFHRLACAIEDAGWELRDTIMWVSASGFPKSYNVSKGIDKVLGAEREVVGRHNGSGMTKSNVAQGAQNRNTLEWDLYSDEPITDEAKKWDGFGTALKPAYEPIIVAQKPLDGGYANNVLRHGAGSLNIDGCRVPVDANDPVHKAFFTQTTSVVYGSYASKERGDRTSMAPPVKGRWPANLIHDGSDEVVGLFPVTTSGGGAKSANRKSPCHGGGWRPDSTQVVGDSGSAARFFYCTKANKRDRDEGCEGLEAAFTPTMGNGIGGKEHDPETATPKRNHHPTVKPTTLMRYLCRLVTPPNGVILDPFMGSGSTGKAAMLEGFHFVGIDKEHEYCETAKHRLLHIVGEKRKAKRIPKRRAKRIKRNTLSR